MRILIVSVLVCFGSSSAAAEPKTAYFADGYHGGVYGHYPPGYTGFIVEQLKANPNWKINLEIEPDTWDVAARLRARGLPGAQGDPGGPVRRGPHRDREPDLRAELPLPEFAARV